MNAGRAGLARFLLNVAGFQASWWACILSARGGAAWVGVTIAAVIAGLHVLFSRRRPFEAWFVPLAAAIGFAADAAATRLGALTFPGTDALPLGAPAWIAALWLAFAATLNTTFDWFHGRPIAAAALGAVSAPISYAAGAAFGVVAMPEPIRSAAILSLLWGITLPVLFSISGRARRRASTNGPWSVSSGEGSR